MMTSHISLILAVGLIAFAHVAVGSETGNESKSFASPSDAIDRVRTKHSEESPVIVAQDELDQLIDARGGGACPISAALIAVQTIRVMADLPVEPLPHRLALQIFKDKPELKEGRISNDRFVKLVSYLCDLIEGVSISTTVVSAPNSPHATSGPRWPVTDGPDLSTSEGELKILAYTVTGADGTVLGRHFVLLKESGNGKLSFLNPGRPLGKRSFIIEYRGNSFASKQRVFFHSPAGKDKSNQTYELNTIFSIRIAQQAKGTEGSVEAMKAKIDALAKRLKQNDEFQSPKAWRREGAAFGLPGLDLPLNVGGRGWSAEKSLEIFRHAGGHNLNLRDVVGGAHGRPLVRSTTTIARRVLDDVIAGKAYVAVAITEPSAGTDMRQMQSKATRHGDGFKLTGKKLWNARLREATHVVIYTLSASGEPGSRTAFLVPIDHPGLRIVDRYAHGLTGNSFGGLEFEEMFVSRDHLLGEDGDGGTIFEEHFTYWRLMQAAAAIGCGEAALDRMAARIQERHAFGGPIGRFTHLQQPIGENLTKLRMAMALAREAARLLDEGDYKAATPLVNGLKAEGVAIALSAADSAMRAHGALGYSREVDLGDRVRDLMGLRIADGTTDVMRMTVVREEYGDDLWKMSVRSYRADNDRDENEANQSQRAATSND